MGDGLSVPFIVSWFETEGKVRYGNYYGSNCLIEKSTGEFSRTSVFSSLSRKNPLFGCYLSYFKRAKFSEDQLKTETSITRPLVCSPRVTN